MGHLPLASWHVVSAHACSLNLAEGMFPSHGPHHTVRPDSGDSHLSTRTPGVWHAAPTQRYSVDLGQALCEPEKFTVELNGHG